MTTDRSPGTPPEPEHAQSDTGSGGRPGSRTWLLGALVVGAVMTATGAALNSAAVAIPGALLAAVTVVAYDKTR